MDSGTQSKNIFRVILSKLARYAAHAVVCLALVFIVLQGLKYRVSLYESTIPIRYHGDINNAYQWGTQANQVGYFALYDRLGAQHAHEKSPDYRLDYLPIRLAAIAMWTQWTHDVVPPGQEWEPKYAYMWPLLWINCAAELAGALGVFFVVRHWVRRTARPDHVPWILRCLAWVAGWTHQDMLAAYQPYRGITRGLIGALLLWFSPTVLWDAHVYVQWDSWLLPFIIFAILAASTNWWFTAGILAGIGGMIKGQMWFGTPVLLLWAIFQLRPVAALRYVAGAMFALAVIGGPWMLREERSWSWISGLAAGCVVAFILIPLIQKVCRNQTPSMIYTEWWGRLSLVIARIALIAVGVALAMYVGSFGTVEVILTGLVLPTLFIAGCALRRLSSRVFAAAIILSAGVFLCVPQFGGSDLWWRLGIEYGSKKYPVLATSGTANLCTILQDRFGWRFNPPPVVDYDLPIVGVGSIELKKLLVITFGCVLVLCGWAAAMCAKRNDARLLVAVVTPWVLFFVLFPQMHSRYMFWGAVVSTVFVGVNFGMTMLCLLLCFLSWSMMATFLLQNSHHPDAVQRNWPGMRDFVLTMNVDSASALLVAAGVLLCAMWPAWSRSTLPELKCD